jgi:DNA gyrase/topoisomerase IV subunit B
MENAEIQNIKKILGLQQDREYDSTNGLRYGHLMIMTDQVCLGTSPILSQLVKLKLFLGLR